MFNDRAQLWVAWSLFHSHLSFKKHTASSWIFTGTITSVNGLQLADAILLGYLQSLPPFLLYFSSESLQLISYASQTKNILAEHFCFKI